MEVFEPQNVRIRGTVGFVAYTVDADAGDLEVGKQTLDIREYAITCRAGSTVEYTGPTDQWIPVQLVSVRFGFCIGHWAPCDNKESTASPPVADGRLRIAQGKPA